MKTRNVVIALATVAVSVAFGVSRGSAGPASFQLGAIRVTAASAAGTSTAGPITAQQALAIVTAKLTKLEPGVNWTSPSSTAATPSVQLVSGLTSIRSVSSGHVLYTRTLPIDAWVVEIPISQGYGFGVVSASTRTTPLLCRGDGCDPPGTPLDVQSFVRP
jgi:hypothetical protein